MSRWRRQQKKRMRRNPIRKVAMGWSALGRVESIRWVQYERVVGALRVAAKVVGIFYGSAERPK